MSFFQFASETNHSVNQVRKTTRQVQIDKLLQDVSKKHQRALGGSLDTNGTIESKHKPQKYDYTEVFCWGNDQFGQLGLQNAEKKKEKGQHSVLIPKTCSFNIVIQQVSCGSEHSAILTSKELFFLTFLKDNGHLYMMGSNKEGQLGIGRHKKVATAPCLVTSFTSSHSVIKVECGSDYTLAIVKAKHLKTKTFYIQQAQKSSELVFGWGSNEHGQLGIPGIEGTELPLQVNYFENNEIQVKDVSCGESHSLFISNQGRVFSCGKGQFGQLGYDKLQFDHSEEPVPVMGLEDQEVKQVAAGVNHTLFLTYDGFVFGCGSNSSYQLGMPNQYQNLTVPQKILGLKHNFIVQISANIHSGAINEFGELFLWGTGIFGTYQQPQKILIISNKVQELKIGNSFGIAIDQKGIAWAWGSNQKGELGTGDFDPRAPPYPILNLKGKKISQLACGKDFVVALGKTYPKKSKKKSVEKKLCSSEKRHTRNSSKEQKQGLRSLTQNKVKLTKGQKAVLLMQNNFSNSFSIRNETLDKSDQLNKTMDACDGFKIINIKNRSSSRISRRTPLQNVIDDKPKIKKQMKKSNSKTKRRQSQPTVQTFRSSKSNLKSPTFTPDLTAKDQISQRRDSALHSQSISNNDDIGHVYTNRSIKKGEREIGKRHSTIIDQTQHPGEFSGDGEQIMYTQPENNGKSQPILTNEKYHPDEDSQENINEKTIRASQKMSRNNLMGSKVYLDETRSDESIKEDNQTFASSNILRLVPEARETLPQEFDTFEQVAYGKTEKHNSKENLNMSNGELPRITEIYEEVTQDDSKILQNSSQFLPPLPPPQQDRSNYATPSKDYQAELVMSEFQKRIDQLEQDKCSQKNKIDKLEAQLEKQNEVENELEQVKALNMKLQEKNLDLELQLQRALDQQMETQIKSSKAVDNMDQLKQENSFLHKKNTSLKDQFNDLQSTYVKQTKEIQEFKEQFNAISALSEKQDQDIKQKFEAIQNKCTHLEATNQELQNERVLLIGKIRNAKSTERQLKEKEKENEKLQDKIKSGKHLSDKKGYEKFVSGISTLKRKEEELRQSLQDLHDSKPNSPQNARNVIFKEQPHQNTIEDIEPCLNSSAFNSRNPFQNQNPRAIPPSSSVKERLLQSAKPGHQRDLSASESAYSAAAFSVWNKENQKEEDSYNQRLMRSIERKALQKINRIN